MFVTILLCVFLSSALLAQNSQQEPKTEPKPTATEPKPVAASGASRTGPGGTDTNDEVARFLIDMTRQWLEANITHDSRILERMLADDYQNMRPTGRFSTKSEEIALVKNHSRADLITFLYAGSKPSKPQRAFPFSIPGVSSRQDQSHRE